MSDPRSVLDAVGAEAARGFTSTEEAFAGRGLSRLHAAPLGDHLGGIDHAEHADPHPAPPDADLPRGGG